MLPLPTAQTPNILTYKLIGCGTNNGRLQHQLFKITTGSLLLQQTHGRTFYIKTAHGLSGRNIFPGFRILFRVPVALFKTPFACAYGGDTIPDNTETSIAKEIYLHKPCLFSPILVPLDDGNTFRRQFNRHVFMEWPGSNNYPAGMDRYMAGNIHQLRSKMYDLGPGFRMALHFLKPCNFTGCQTKGLGRFTYGHAWLKTNNRGNHGRMIFVFTQHLCKDCVPFVPGKINIYIRSITAPGI